MFAVAPPTGSVDRNFYHRVEIIQIVVSPPRGASIEIQLPYRRQTFTGVAPPRGAWINLKMLKVYFLTSVAPPRGAWIEIVEDTMKKLRKQSLPPRGAWIRNNELLEEGK